MANKKIQKSDWPVIYKRAREDKEPVTQIAAAYGVTAANIYVILKKQSLELETATTAPLAAVPAAPETVETAPAAAEAGSFTEEAPESATEATEIAAVQRIADASRSVSEPVASGDQPAPDSQPMLNLEPPPAPPQPLAPTDAEPEAMPAPSLPEPPASSVAPEPEPAAPAPAPAPAAPAKPAAAPAPQPPKPAPAPTPRGSKNASKATGKERDAGRGKGLVIQNADGDENIIPFKTLEDLLSNCKQILRTFARWDLPVWFCIRDIDLADFRED